MGAILLPLASTRMLACVLRHFHVNTAPGRAISNTHRAEILFKSTPIVCVPLFLSRTYDPPQTTNLCPPSSFPLPVFYLYATRSWNFFFREQHPAWSERANPTPHNPDRFFKHHIVEYFHFHQARKKRVADVFIYALDGILHTRRAAFSSAVSPTAAVPRNTSQKL